MGGAVAQCGRLNGLPRWPCIRSADYDEAMTLTQTALVDSLVVNLSSLGGFVYRLKVRRDQRKAEAERIKRINEGPLIEFI